MIAFANHSSKKGDHMKRLLSALALLTVGVLPFGAHAQFAKVEDAVKYRQSTFVVMAAHFSRVGAVVKGEKPYDKAAVEADLAVVEMMSRLPWHAFPQGSDTPNSKAKAEVWQEQGDFKAAAEKNQAAIAKLVAAGKTGDLGTIKTAFGAAGQSCKACHDDFRRK
jgi:cytochrome c556